MGTKIELGKQWYVKGNVQPPKEAPDMEQTGWQQIGNIDWNITAGQTVEATTGSWAELVEVHSYEMTTAIEASKGLKPGIETQGKVNIQEGKDTIVYSLENNGASFEVKPIGYETGFKATNVPEKAHVPGEPYAFSVVHKGESTEQWDFGPTHVKYIDDLVLHKPYVLHTGVPVFTDAQFTAMVDQPEVVTIIQMPTLVHQDQPIIGEAEEIKGGTKGKKVKHEYTFEQLGLEPGKNGLWQKALWLEDPSLAVHQPIVTE